MIKYLNKLCKNIVAGKFNDKKYRQRKGYFGVEIMTNPLFCSYGTIGFTVIVYLDNCTYTVEYDGEMNKLSIDDVFWKDWLNLEYLAKHDIYQTSKDPVWDDKPRSVELECYTDAGEDMIITLESPTRKHLGKYIDDFDIDESVAMWWPDGQKIEGKGVPFNNMKEHYEDYEAYLKWLRKVCDKMPY